MDNIDRRKVEKLREFFKQIPFLKILPRSVLNTLHLSLTRKRYQRGQIVCKEGEESNEIFIICKGEFEVNKVIDTSKANKIPHAKPISQTKANQQYLPKRKLA